MRTNPAASHRKLRLVCVAGSLLLVGGIATGCTSQTAADVEPSASTTTKKPKTTAKPSPTPTPSPTFTRRATPTPTPTKPAAPLFVASLPATVAAGVGQKIVVQIPEESGETWQASGSGPVTVSGTKHVDPPESQPDAPGTSITTLLATKAGTAKVVFTLSPAGTTKTLTVKVK